MATGSKINQFFVGDISTEYKSGNTAVNVKVNTSSNVRKMMSQVLKDNFELALVLF